MRMQLETWNSHDIQDTSYKAIEPIGSSNGNAGAQPNYIDIGQGNPVFAGKTLQGTLYTFQVQCLGTTDAMIESQRDTLMGWFDVGDFTPHQLVGIDIDNSNKDWYLEGTVVSGPTLVPGAVKNLYSITLALTSPYWYENDLNTNTWSITASTETEVMTSTGNMPALPKFVISPLQAKSSNDVKYREFWAVHSGDVYGFTSKPVDITNSLFDTAALVTAGKMEADGKDLRVNLNGVNVDYWIGGGGINTATTGIWINMSLVPVPPMTLKTSLPNNDTVPSALYVTYAETYDAYATQIPQNKSLQIENEIITYSTYTIDVPTRTITFVPTQRAAKDGAYAAHTAGVDVFSIQNDIWTTHGNSSLTAQVMDDSKKPIIDVATSTNASKVYLLFGDSTNLRTGAPINFSRILHGSTYTGSHGASADPYTELGLKLSSLLVGSSVVSDTTTVLQYLFNEPGGISHIVANGFKYRSGATWGTFRIGVSNFLYGAITTITTPSTVDTWEAVAIDEDITDDSTQLTIQASGGLGTTLPAPYAMVEFTDITLTIDKPVVVYQVATAGANYKLSGSLANSTTGESILFSDLITKIGQTVTIDCDTLEIYGSDGTRIRGMISFGGTKRDGWITLASGANSIVFTDTGTVEVSIVTTWRGRNTI